MTALALCLIAVGPLGFYLAGELAGSKAEIIVSTGESVGIRENIIVEGSHDARVTKMKLRVFLWGGALTLFVGVLILL